MTRTRRYLMIALVTGLSLALTSGISYLMLRASTSSRPIAAKGHGPGTDDHGHKDGGGKVKMTDAQVAAANIELLSADAGRLQESLRLNGMIQPNQEAMVQVSPRFPGVIREVRRRLGDQVQAGDVLATIESNQSLTVYELKAPIAGTIIERNAARGEYVSEQKSAFVIADLTSVWVDLSVYRRDFAKLHIGDKVLIDMDDGTEPVATRITYVSPIGSSDTQTALVRAVAANDSRLRPGLFVTARLVHSSKAADVVVKLSALQTIEGKTVVFVRNGDQFEAREVELGVRDGEHVEVLFGLLPGDKYAGRNSFVVKAELAKAGATHEH